MQPVHNATNYHNILNLANHTDVYEGLQIEALRCLFDHDDGIPQMAANALQQSMSVGSIKKSVTMSVDEISPSNQTEFEFTMARLFSFLMAPPSAVPDGATTKKANNTVPPFWDCLSVPAAVAAAVDTSFGTGEKHSTHNRISKEEHAAMIEQLRNDSVVGPLLAFARDAMQRAAWHN